MYYQVPHSGVLHMRLKLPLVGLLHIHYEAAHGGICCTHTIKFPMVVYPTDLSA